jgi:hypothetical protein
MENNSVCYSLPSNSGIVLQPDHVRFLLTLLKFITSCYTAQILTASLNKTQPKEAASDYGKSQRITARTESLGQNSNPRSPEYETGMVSTYSSS